MENTAIELVFYLYGIFSFVTAIEAAIVIAVALLLTLRRK